MVKQQMTKKDHENEYWGRNDPPTKWSKNITIIHDTPTQWNWVVSRPENLTLGNFVDIGAFTYINAKYGILIEDNVQIGSHCSIYTHNTIDNKMGDIVIQRGAKIGSHCVIMPNVNIGKNAKIGAYSLVKCDVPDGETWVGVPAKKLIRHSKKL